MAAIPASSARKAVLSSSWPGTYWRALIWCVFWPVSIRSSNVAIFVSAKKEPSLTAIAVLADMDAAIASICSSVHSRCWRRYLAVSPMFLMISWRVVAVGSFGSWIAECPRQLTFPS